MTARAQLHRLLDTLPDDALDDAGRMLAGLSTGPIDDPVAAALARAPLDDEPVTPRDVDATLEGERDVEAGRVVTAAELRAGGGRAQGSLAASRRGVCRAVAIGIGRPCSRRIALGARGRQGPQ